MGHASPYKYKDIQLPQLRSFCLAATEGNFTAAAAVLGISVSAVWQQVRALERELGTTLFRRQGRTVELTVAGRLLLELAAPHVTGLDSLAQLFHTRQDGMQEVLTVVATPHLLLYHLPDMVQQFVRGHGMARLHMRAALWYQILDLVEHGEADLGICPWDRGTPHRAALHYETLFELPLLLLTDAEHPLRRKKTLRARDLVEHPFIAEPKETCDYKVLLRMLGRDNVSEEQLNIVMIAHTVEMTLRYVARGVGIGLSHVDPRTCKQVPNVYGRVFDPGLEKLPFALVIRRNSHRTALVDEFCAAVRKTLAK